VIAAWGVGEDGRKVLLHLMAGSKEETETVRAFFQDMRSRRLGDPLLVVSDGASDIIRAIEGCFPARHASAALPTGCAISPSRFRHFWPEFKARVTACYQAPSRAIARELANGIRTDYATTLPSTAHLLRGRLRGVHCASSTARHASPSDAHDESSRTSLRRGAPAPEDHLQRLARSRFLS
jgi:hypothetical protein